MEDTAMIYGPRLGQLPVFTVDGVTVCLANIDGFPAVLVTDAVDVDHARKASGSLIAALADWFDVTELAVIGEDHYREFHRIGHLTTHSGQPGHWPLTFTVDDVAGTVMLYPIPHKASETLTGWLIEPHPPVLFSEPVVDSHQYPRGSDHDHLVRHLAALLALHRIRAAVTVHIGDRTYRAPGTSVISARIYHPGVSTDLAGQQQWVSDVLAAVTAVPNITARPYPQPPAAGRPPDVLVEYARPRRPWTTYPSDEEPPLR